MAVTFTTGDIFSTYTIIATFLFLHHNAVRSWALVVPECVCQPGMLSMQGFVTLLGAGLLFNDYRGIWQMCRASPLQDQSLRKQLTLSIVYNPGWDEERCYISCNSCRI